MSSDTFKKRYISEKVAKWAEDVRELHSIAKSESQAAYTAYVFAIQSRWKFYQRTIPGVADEFKPLEKEIHQNLLKNITGREIS